MFGNQIWENIGIQFDDFFAFKFRITFDISPWEAFLNEKMNQDSFFNIKNTRLFFKRFSDSWERMCFFFEKWLQWLGVFKFETTFEKTFFKILLIFWSSKYVFLLH